MPRGNPNFKPKYSGEPTKVIRLPQSLADKLLEVLSEGTQVEELLQLLRDVNSPLNSAKQLPQESNELNQLKVKRLNLEIDRLSEKVNALDLENQALAGRLIQTRTELEEMRLELKKENTPIVTLQ